MLAPFRKRKDTDTTDIKPVPLKDRKPDPKVKPVIVNQKAMKIKKK